MTLVASLSHGTVTPHENGSFTYTHDGSQSTSDSATYMANDGSMDSNLATVSINVISSQNDMGARGDAYNSYSAHDSATELGRSASGTGTSNFAGD